MSELTIDHIDEVLANGEPYYFIKILNAKGSTPRDAGAMMIVGRDEIHGTIGGGSAEWAAINTAREFIGGAKFNEKQIITLGPEIDQCCGGTLEVGYRLVDDDLRQEAGQFINAKEPANVIIFGAGHTGLALANALLPFTPHHMDVEIIDTRTSYVDKIGTHKLRCLAVPEEAVRGAKAGSIFVVTTHDHSLDFFITAEALKRRDARYVGMIGSKTKRAVLKSWMGANGYEQSGFEELHCPIGSNHVRNKQPEIIAALSAAEILAAID